MKIKEYFIWSLLLVSIYSFGQSPNLNCEYFKNGTFYIPFDYRVKRSYHVFRNGQNQIEVDNYKNETYVSIIWDGDCGYTAFLQPDSAKEKADERPDFILDSTAVRFIRSKGDTLYYSSVSFFGEKKLEYSGWMIRIGDIPPRD